MKYLSNYTDFNKKINESHTIDDILDKISKYGMDSLTDNERHILDNPNDVPKEFEIDSDGDMAMNGEKVTKKDPITSWNKDAEYEVLEYLYQNFYRIISDEYVAEDNIGRKLTLIEITDRVKKYFNTDIPEITELIGKWSTGLLTEKKDVDPDYGDEEEKLKFGKYKGKTPTEIAKKDIKYLKYLLSADIKWRGGLNKSLRTLIEIERAVKKNSK